MKNHQEMTLLAIAFYIIAMVVILSLITAFRLGYQRITSDPAPVRQQFIYGILYARSLALIGCASGFIGVVLCDWLEVSAWYSLLACPVLPIVMHVTTTERDRIARLMGK